MIKDSGDRTKFGTGARIYYDADADKRKRSGG